MDAASFADIEAEFMTRMNRIVWCTVVTSDAKGRPRSRILPAGVAASLPGFNRWIRTLLRDPAAGADTIVWLAGSAEAAQSTGEFCHDPRVRPKHRVPWTRETPEERARLFTMCEDLCGRSPGGATATPSTDTKGD